LSASINWKNSNHYPRPPDAQMLDASINRVRVGPYVITYEIDDKQRRVRVFLLEEMEEA